MLFCPDTLTVQVAANDSLGDLDFTGFYNPQPIDSIFGTVFEDVDGDCMRDSFEIGYAGWTIQLTIYQGADPLGLTAISDADGHYVFTNPDGFTNAAGGYVLAQSDPADGLQCQATCGERLLHFSSGATTFQADFGVRCDSLPPCTGMEVDIVTNLIRPCTSTQYHVNYCNNGLQTATGAYITVSLASILQVTGASLPYTVLPDSSLRFDLGTVSTEQCGNFTIDAAVVCDATITGQTFCAEAHIYPDTSCAPQYVTPNGSQLLLTGTCAQDSAIFIIKNISNTNLVHTVDYVVIEDNVLLKSAVLGNLAAGESKRMAYPANGHFYRLAVEVQGFGEANHIAVWVEGCASNQSSPLSLGFVNQYPLGDEEPWLDIFCLESRNSFDPNEKTGYPIGVDNEHYVEANTELEYFVQFQNTGTAEAYNIEIRDTLAAGLDIASARPGASSHAYTFDLQGNNVVVFKFTNIYLPDSNSNEAASHGFVKFRVKQQPNLALGTKIENQAAIFFDFNAPVITNRAWHTIGKDFLVVKTFVPDVQDLMLTVQPNPVQDRCVLLLKGLGEPLPDCLLRVYDMAGKSVLERAFSGTRLELDASALGAGSYSFEVLAGAQRIGRGRFVRM